VMCSSRAVGRALLEILICTRAGSCFSITITVLQKVWRQGLLWHQNCFGISKWLNGVNVNVC
jgi:hypothetical protein